MPQPVPAEAPPSYAHATGSSTASGAASSSDTTHLNVPGSNDNKTRIPLEHRRSMEDEVRRLPPGWVRQFDASSQHQFFVDTTATPPRSIWHHPYDDETYLASLSPAERERLEQENIDRAKELSKHDVIHAHSDDEDENIPDELPSRDGKGKGPDHRTFGRKFKDKFTGTTHEQRVQERKQRAEQEQRAYEQHVRIRQAMAEAAQTGKPVKVGRDADGKDVYVEPPMYGGGAYGPGGYGVSPYGGQPYHDPNARYIRPSGAYGRAYDGWDYGYGGGYGRGGYGYGYGGYGGGLAPGLMLGGGMGLLMGGLLL